MFIIPEPKQISFERVDRFIFDTVKVNNNLDFIKDAEILLHKKFWNFINLRIGSAEPSDYRSQLVVNIESSHALIDQIVAEDKELFLKQGYRLLVCETSIVNIYCNSLEGYLNALSSLKQMIYIFDDKYALEWSVDLIDWPCIEFRGISTTFAWYAGYGRIGFDMQLWGLDEWKQFVNVCSDYKINQINMVLYGFWPFKFPEYPGVSLENFEMDVWNAESENWITIQYSHPNVHNEFLPELIEYGHSLGISFFAYVGLNSYNGGLSSIRRDKRMKLPKNSKFINDFDSLCLSESGTVEYITDSMCKILSLGFDGLDLEESEEAFWYCQCNGCQSKFNTDNNTPEQMLHEANTWLLKIVYDEVKKQYPNTTIGLRAWRQPPLVRSMELLEEMRASIPDDVVLFWSPGHYVDENEFKKWIRTFGKERIRGRDTEAIGFASGLGRLIRPFKWMGLRTDEEAITQYLEEDIRQHIESAKLRVAGINGYQFEWFGFFMALFIHSNYGWGSTLDPEIFYRKSFNSVFGELGDDILSVMKHMFTIHESQLGIFDLYFPFAKNKVEERDIDRILEAREQAPKLLEKLSQIKMFLAEDHSVCHFIPHFTKWEVSIRRSLIIYEMALLDIELANTTDESKRKVLLKQLDHLNDKSFEVVKANYFDVNPVDKAGIHSCMIPYHELKRCIHNQLNPEDKDDQPIYLGVESLGWMWF